MAAGQAAPRRRLVPADDRHLADLATAITTHSLRAVLAAPFTGWAGSWHAFSYGATSTAFVLAAPVAVPAGLLIASWAWQVRIYRIETGLAGRDRDRAGHLRPPAMAPPGQRPRPARTPPPAWCPLTDRKDRIVIGGTIRAVGHPWRPVLAIPASAMGTASGDHRVVRVREDEPDDPHLGRVVHRRPPAASERGAPRPLLVVLDCKGGPDARAKAARTTRLLHAAGATDIRIWPDQASVSLWSLPPA